MQSVTTVRIQIACEERFSANSNGKVNMKTNEKTSKLKVRALRIAVVLAKAIAIIMPYLVYPIWWALTLLVTWLISLCFAIEWSVAIGTGVWLCCLLLTQTIKFGTIE